MISTFIMLSLTRNYEVMLYLSEMSVFAKQLIYRISMHFLREHSFFRRRGGPEEFRGESLTFCLLKKGGSVKI